MRIECSLAFVQLVDRDRNACRSSHRAAAAAEDIASLPGEHRELVRVRCPNMGTQSDWDFTNPIPRSTPPKGKETFSSGVTGTEARPSSIGSRTRSRRRRPSPRNFRGQGGEIHIARSSTTHPAPSTWRSWTARTSNQPAGGVTASAVPRHDAASRKALAGTWTRTAAVHKGNRAARPGRSCDRGVHHLARRPRVSELRCSVPVHPHVSQPGRLRRPTRACVGSRLQPAALQRAGASRPDGSPPPPVAYTRLGSRSVGAVLSPPGGHLRSDAVAHERRRNHPRVPRDRAQRRDNQLSIERQTLPDVDGTDAPAGPTWTLRSTRWRCPVVRCRRPPGALGRPQRRWPRTGVGRYRQTRHGSCRSPTASGV